ncbi:FAD-dependent monooxygenase [uncultured Legionella sp.]|uniref:FAD-dependent monooxygenase n=1 Tax=uncultured Legionella sp. TaxID=210934 RepID=UPI002601F0F3|nr:FAD-dependent monooxygenase [uncultured Legionella sp.]
MSHQFDVLVVGGGVVGLAAAIAMAQCKHSVAIIDAGSLSVDVTATDMRVYAINKASQSLLKQLDVWSYLDNSRVSPYHQMHVWDASNGAYIDFDSRLIAEQNLGAIIEESILKQALLQKISSEPNISLFSHSTIDEVIELENGIKISSQNDAWHGQLLMVTDGANSPTRKKLNIELTSWAYEQNALVATVATEKPHLSTAYQVFNSDGPLAFLPLVNPHQCSIVWSTNPIRAQKMMALGEEEFNLELTRAFARHLGKVELLSARHQFPLRMRHVKQYAGTRWLLLGDAAHTIHPLAGLGLNVGLADVSSWINLSERFKDVPASKRALRAYQRERKHAVWQIILMMEGFKQLFTNNSMPIMALRGLGLRFCNEFSSIKRICIDHAAGL